MSERKLTIARGLTRLKTIKAQLENISTNIQQYGAWNDKTKHPLGDTTHNDIKKNHAQAREKVASLYQQFNDLKAEYIKIKLAIDKANMVTDIEVAGKVMTIHEALIYEREIATFITRLTGAYKGSVASAELKVRQFNNQFANLQDENIKASLLADISYLVSKDVIEELDKFAIEFLTEIDGIKNEVNALTEIQVD
jgi:hypothetical protein